MEELYRVAIHIMTFPQSESSEENKYKELQITFRALLLNEYNVLRNSQPYHGGTNLKILVHKQTYIGKYLLFYRG